MSPVRRVGIAFDLRDDFVARETDPEDRLEEYDSRDTVEAIAGAIRALGLEPIELGGGRRFVERLLADPPDLVFNLAEGFGTRSREAQLPAVMELLGVPFTHSDPLTLAATLDKDVARKLCAAEGVPVPRGRRVERMRDLDDLDFGYPMICKPLAEGSSMGVRRRSRVTSAKELRDRVGELVEEYRQPALVEEFLPGTELTVGIVGNGAEARVLGVMEIAPRKDRADEFVYSLEVKRNWREEVEYHVPPRAPGLAVRAGRVALDAYHVLGCRDLARVDLRLDAAGHPRFIEVNPLPGLNPISGDIVIIANRTGISYEGLIAAIIEAAVGRQGLELAR